MCQYTFKRGHNLGFKDWLASWLQNQNANEKGNSKEIRQLNSAALKLNDSLHENEHNSSLRATVNTEPNT